MTSADSCRELIKRYYKMSAFERTFVVHALRVAVQNVAYEEVQACEAHIGAENYCDLLQLTISRATIGGDVPAPDSAAKCAAPIGQSANPRHEQHGTPEFAAPTEPNVGNAATEMPAEHSTVSTSAPATPVNAREATSPSLSNDASDVRNPRIEVTSRKKITKKARGLTAKALYGATTAKTILELGACE